MGSAGRARRDAALRPDPAGVVRRLGDARERASWRAASPIRAIASPRWSWAARASGPSARCSGTRTATRTPCCGWCAPRRSAGSASVRSCSTSSSASRMPRRPARGRRCRCSTRSGRLFLLLDWTTPWIHPSVERTSWGWAYSLGPAYPFFYRLHDGERRARRSGSASRPFAAPPRRENARRPSG